jgi:hypothetical protein
MACHDIQWKIMGCYGMESEGNKAWHDMAWKGKAWHGMKIQGKTW